jgi:hypothetical protein
MMYIFNTKVNINVVCIRALGKNTYGDMVYGVSLLASRMLL